MAYLEPSAQTNFSSNLHVLGRKLQITSADRLASVYLTTACLPAVHASSAVEMYRLTPDQGPGRITDQFLIGLGFKTAGKSHCNADCGTI